MANLEHRPVDETGGILQMKRLSRQIAISFYVYTVLITFLKVYGWRLFGYDGLVLGIGFVELISYRRFPFVSIGGYLFMALPVVISIYALKSSFDARSVKYVRAFSLCAILNQLSLLIFEIPGSMLANSVNPNFYIGRTLSAFLIIFMIFLFIACGKLTRLKKENGDTEFESSHGYITLMMMLFIGSGVLYVHPYEMKIPSAKTVLGGLFADGITPEDFTILPFGDAISIQVSPDGKYIAMANEYAVTLWNAQEKTLIMYDDSISPYSVRFSNSGRYLEAGGEIPNGTRRKNTKYRELSIAAVHEEYPFAVGIKNTEKSCVAVYDVERMKRLPLISMPPANIPETITWVRNVAFKPDEKTFAFIYDLYIPAFGGIEVGVLNGRVFTELELSTGQRLSEQKFDPSNFIQKRSGRNFISPPRISPDGRLFIYFQDLENTLSYYETSSWLENKMILGTKYGTVNFSDDWIWGDKIFFSYRAEKIIDRSLRFNEYIKEVERKNDEVFAELDLGKQIIRDIMNTRSIDIDIEIRTYAVSPDGEKAIIVCSKDRQSSYFYLVIINLINDDEPVIKQIRFRRGADPVVPNKVAWLDKSSVILSFPKWHVKAGSGKKYDSEPHFCYVDISKEVGIK